MGAGFALGAAFGAAAFTALAAAALGAALATAALGAALAGFDLGAGLGAAALGAFTAFTATTFGACCHVGVRLGGRGSGFWVHAIPLLSYIVLAFC